MFVKWILLFNVMNNFEMHNTQHVWMATDGAPALKLFIDSQLDKYEWLVRV